MDRYNCDINDELINLRDDMTELRRLLGSQQIVTEKLMRSVMTQNTKWIRNFIRLETYVLLPLSLFFILGALFDALGWPFAVFTVIMCTADVLVDRKINDLSPADYAVMSLLDLKERIIRQKKLRRKSLIISFVVLVPWFVWFLCEMGMREHPFFQGAMIGGIIGGIVGALLGYKVYLKMQSIDDSVLAQISEVRDSENE